MTVTCGARQQARHIAGPPVALVALVATFATVALDPATGRWVVQSVWCPASATAAVGPTATMTLTVRPAKAVLVPDPH